MTIDEKTEVEVYRQATDIVDTLKIEKDELIERGRQRFEEAVKKKDNIAANNAQYLADEFIPLVDKAYAAFRKLITKSYNEYEGNKLAPRNPEPFFHTVEMLTSGSSSLEIRGKLNAMYRYITDMKKKHGDKIENPAPPI